MLWLLLPEGLRGSLSGGTDMEGSSADIYIYYYYILPYIRLCVYTSSVYMLGSQSFGESIPMMNCRLAFRVGLNW